MEKINNIFLNYKTYDAFLQDLFDEKISPSSIAFIQDNRRIWAHGKEYACNSLTVVDNGEGSISFVDSLGNTLLALSADPNGYINVAGITEQAYTVFVSRGDFANYVEAVELLKRDFERYKSIVIGGLEKFVMEDEVQDTIDPDSTYPVQSKIIHRALETKQDKLVAGAGIEIQGNIISSYGTKIVTLTQSQYQLLVDSGQVERDTYYFTYEGEEPSGNSWHFGESFPIILTDTWEFGGTFPITLTDRSTDSIGVLPITLT